MPVLIKHDGEKIYVSIYRGDVRLYEAPPRPSGIDIYAHKSQSGTIYYYTCSWSLAGSSRYSLIAPDEVQDRLIDLAGLPGDDRLTDDEMKTADQYFPGIFKAPPVTDLKRKRAAAFSKKIHKTLTSQSL